MSYPKVYVVLACILSNFGAEHLMTCAPINSILGVHARFSQAGKLASARMAERTPALNGTSPVTVLT